MELLVIGGEITTSSIQGPLVVALHVYTTGHINNAIAILVALLLVIIRVNLAHLADDIVTVTGASLLKRKA